MSFAPRGVRDRWLDICVVYLPLFWLGLLGLYLKAELIDGYSLAVARLLSAGTQELVATPLSTAAAYFSGDVVVNLLLVPALLGGLACAIFRRHAAAATLVVSCVLMFYYFVQLRTQQTVGQYVSLPVLYEGVKFTATNADLASNYVSGSALIKLAIMLSAAVSTSLLAGWLVHSGRLRALATLFGAILTAIVVAAGATAVTLYPFGEATGLHQSAVHKMLNASLADFYGVDRVEKDIAAGVADFRKLTHTPAPGSTGDPLQGLEKGSNVLLFILETGPSDVLPDGDVSELVPSRLATNTLIATSHYTTYPYTSDAIFSILSGLYPDGRRDIVTSGGFKRYKVFFNMLADAGYDTEAFAPDIYNKEVDENMWRQFGVQQVFVANRAPASSVLETAKTDAQSAAEAILNSNPRFEERRKAELLRRLTNDLHALEQMKARARSAIAGGKRFGFVFMPQIGHGPWLHLGSGGTWRSYGHELMRMQSRWLDGFVGMLQDSGELGRTVIVLTADHGIRTKVEDPQFDAGTISSYAFHVPLAIYAPNAFPQQRTVGSMTSHIDLEPTLSCLFGFRCDGGYAEGIPLWNAASGRRLYFFSEGYGGADGFYDGRFFMSNLVTDTQYESASMSFTAPGLAIKDPGQRNFVRNGLAQFRGAHYGIVSNLN